MPSRFTLQVNPTTPPDFTDDPHTMRIPSLTPHPTQTGLQPPLFDLTEQKSKSRRNPAIIVGTLVFFSRFSGFCSLDKQFTSCFSARYHQIY
jgi:hypothetical protein